MSLNSECLQAEDEAPPSSLGWTDGHRADNMGPEGHLPQLPPGVCFKKIPPLETYRFILCGGRGQAAVALISCDFCVPDRLRISAFFFILSKTSLAPKHLHSGAEVHFLAPGSPTGGPKLFSLVETVALETFAREAIWLGALPPI